MPRMSGLGWSGEPVAGGRRADFGRAPAVLDTREQMVASIISKKLAAGSTHLVIDIPVGPAAKLTTAWRRCGCASCSSSWRSLRHLG